MTQIMTAISEFYREDIAHMEITCRPHESVKVIFPLKRFYFLTGSNLAILFLIQKVTLSIFSLTKVILTCGHQKKFRLSLFKNIQETSKYLGAIPMGWLGILFPKTINQKFLQIPDRGLITYSY